MEKKTTDTRTTQERKKEDGLSVYGYSYIDNAIVAYHRQSYILITEVKDSDNRITLLSSCDSDYSITNRHCDINHSKAVKQYAIDLGLEKLNIAKTIEEWKFRTYKACFKAFETIQKFVDYKDIHDLLS